MREGWVGLPYGWPNVVLVNALETEEAEVENEDRGNLCWCNVDDTLVRQRVA